MNNTQSDERAADFLVKQLETRILANELKDGDNLPSERKLMNQYGLSRTVIREAVAMLSTKGLIQTKPRFRPVVCKPSFDDAVDVVGGMIGHLLNQPSGIKNLFNTRVLIEVTLVREAALRADKNDIKALRTALEANKSAIDDLQEFYVTDVAFHAILYEIPKNPVLPAIHKAYTSWLAVHWQQMPRLDYRNQMNYEYHEAIFNAILNRDPDEAEEKLRDHLTLGWEHIKTTFKELD